LFSIASTSPRLSMALVAVSLPKSLILRMMGLCFIAFMCAEVTMSLLPVAVQ